MRFILTFSTITLLVQGSISCSETQFVSQSKKSSDQQLTSKNPGDFQDSLEFENRKFSFLTIKENKDLAAMVVLIKDTSKSMKEYNNIFGNLSPSG
jgi:hypothetical protein